MSRTLAIGGDHETSGSVALLGWVSGIFQVSPLQIKLKSKIVVILDPNVAKIPYRRVGCAHQISLISFVKGGQSPPYNNNIGLHCFYKPHHLIWNHGCEPLFVTELHENWTWV